MNKVHDRKILKPVRKRNGSYSPKLTSPSKTTDTPSSTPTNKHCSGPSSGKFSANDRLKKYRESLEGRKNEIVKVHKVFSSSKPKNVLGKRALTKEFDATQEPGSNSSDSKKRKSNEFANNNSKYKNCKNVDKSFKRESTSITESAPQISNNPEEYSDMDWSPVNEDDVILNIQMFRDSQKDCNLPLQSNTSDPKTTINSSEHNSVNDVIHIVVDTNIFISNLNIVEQLLSEENNFVVYVPWMVFQELDYFKDGRAGHSTLLKQANRAIRFINGNLTKKHVRLKGQTVREALNQQQSSSNPDDNIIFCCIQLLQMLKTVILLTNDVNLRNKALINNITSYGPKDILSQLEEASRNVENKRKIFSISTLLSNMCTEIILAEMKDAYGSVLSRMVAEPPWDLKQCLTYLKRFWIPVFSLIIKQKQCLKSIEDLLTFIQTCNDLTVESNMEQFIKLCLNMCVYFKNCIHRNEKTVASCINCIQEIVS